jgi:antitoxin HigA-1
MQMHSPPHPGEVIRELCLVPLGLTVTAAAMSLGISRKSLSELLNGRSGVSAEMALRLSLAFGTTAESWLNQQMQYDLGSFGRRRED